MNISNEIMNRIKEWTEEPYSKECRDEINQLIINNNEIELKERFGAELDFGTGGIRGIIGYGTNRMNIHIIAKTTQGLANYIIKNQIDAPKAVIAYDSRHFSKEFAAKAAQVLAANGIKTYLFKELRPTPELSFAVRYLKCTTGIVITASHNPKEYNGYKVYWSDGAQIISPHDKGIIEEVRNVKKLQQVKEENFNQLLQDQMIEWIGEEIDELFLNEIIKLSIQRNKIKESNVKIVYTPLHGTGAALAAKAFHKLGLNNILFVDEQMKPDPNFSTVKYPNPEKEDALQMGIKIAKQNDADIVLATDPDADRLGLVVRDNDGNYQIINGNQIGVIMEYYILKEKKAANQLPNNGAIIKTIVTTKLQDVIGKDFGMQVFNVLTGFKYIGGKIRNFEEDKNYQYIFGNEESYGYLTGTHARDKDGISAMLMMAECCAFLKTQNMTILDLLQEIYNKYGYYKDALITRQIEGLAGQEMILKIMDYFRKTKLDMIGNVKIDQYIDYLNDKVKDTEGSPYYLPFSNVLQYHLQDGSTVTLRPSGTEPIIKFYFSTIADDLKKAEDKVELFKQDFMTQVDKVLKKG